MHPGGMRDEPRHKPPTGRTLFTAPEGKHGYAKQSKILQKYKTKMIKAASLLLLLACVPSTLSHTSRYDSTLNHWARFSPLPSFPTEKKKVTLPISELCFCTHTPLHACTVTVCRRRNMPLKLPTTQVNYQTDSPLSKMIHYPFPSHRVHSRLPGPFVAGDGSSNGRVASKAVQDAQCALDFTLGGAKFNVSELQIDVGRSHTCYNTCTFGN